MHFLYPGFLWALGVIAVPVIIHLLNLRRYKKVYFANVRLLQEVDKQTRSTKSLKHFLVLLCRILALTFLVLAFARPFIPADESQNKVKNKVAIYLDNSFSMESETGEGRAFDVAKNKVYEIIKAYPPGTLFKLLTNDYEGYSSHFADKEKVITHLDEAKLSPVVRSYEEILKRLQPSGNDSVNQVTYLVSDFKKNNFSGQEAAEIKPLYLVHIPATFVQNLSIDSIWFEQPFVRSNSVAKLFYRVRNYGKEGIDDLQVQFFVDDNSKSISQVNIPAGKTAEQNFSFNTPTGGWHNAYIAIADQSVKFDDTLFFSFFVNEGLQVQVAEDLAKKPYLQKVFQAEPFFSVSNTPVAPLVPGENTALLAVNTSRTFSSLEISSIKKFVEEGNNLCLFPPLQQEQVTGFNQVLNALNIPPLGEQVQAEERAEQIDFQHPLISMIFQGKQQDFDKPKVKKYYTATAPGDHKDKIIALKNGEDWLSTYRRGNGQVYLFYSPLDTSATSFAQNPLFLSILYNMAFHNRYENDLFYTCGSRKITFLPAYAQQGKDKLPVLRNKRSNFELLPQLTFAEGKQGYVLARFVKQAGNYELYTSDDKLLGLLSFNFERRESDLSNMDEAGLDAFAGKVKANIYKADKADLAASIREQAQGKQFWKHCLVLALIFILAEILLLRYYKA